MFMLYGKKKIPHDSGCFVCHVFVACFLLLIAAASFSDALMSHYDFKHSMFVFGSNAGALSLLSLAVSVSLWMLQMKACMSDCNACGPMPTGKKK